jgi:cell wall assembly regulator SMI1
MKEIWNSLHNTAKKISPEVSLINKNLPQDFFDLYLMNNGNPIESAKLFNGVRLLSIEEITTIWQSMKEIKASGAFIINDKEIVADADSAILSDWWNEAWLPITDNMSGDYTILDLAPNVGGTYGQIFQYWHDSSYRTLEATSLKFWLMQTAEKIEKGISKYDESYNAFIEF